MLIISYFDMAFCTNRKLPAKSRFVKTLKSTWISGRSMNKRLSGVIVLEKWLTAVFRTMGKLNSAYFKPYFRGTMLTVNLSRKRSQCFPKWNRYKSCNSWNWLSTKLPFPVHEKFVRNVKGRETSGNTESIAYFISFLYRT